MTRAAVRCASEAVGGLAVRVAEGEDLGGCDPVDPGAALGGSTRVAQLDELLAADLEPPVVAVLGGPFRAQPLEHLRILDAHGRALDHDVLAAVPAVRAHASRRHGYHR